ncbi:Similar to PIG-Z: GPI mannosyltransferase 4 (Drosophila melanogaster) [Cotesia congregata]|uniref:Mannosyltransferase n=1 Tax=Cotesia congregata TaxID=51543 RepID=A0A8J2HLW5_COTCN|nr:Similar to PIG-Z: GPI mannosyltransferase 4 (Drosophila melanogaster) [Cotesia congregata]
MMTLRDLIRRFTRTTTSKSSQEKTKKVENKPSLIVYWILAGIRILLTLLPQTGYIHPDEYFQSIEVIAGDRFDIDVYKPWEYNTTFPIRSAFVSEVIIGVPYSIINVLSPYLWYYLQVKIRTPYFLVTVPRLAICILSFLSDYCLFKLCQICKLNYRSRLIIYASSYVMMIYATRTLSNSIELILNTLLIYYVSRCIVYSEQVVIQSDHFKDAYDKAQNIVERVKYYKLRASLPSHSLNHCLILATLTVLGIFNRPTFIAYAFPPIFFWLQRGLGSDSVNLWDFHVRIIMFILCGIPVTLFLIIVDSFYFGYLTLGEIINLDVGFKNIIVTPLNFLSITKRHWLELPRIQSIESLMTACFILPIGLLSLFPHQEPRFIIPVIFPVVFLYSPIIERSNRLLVCKNTREIVGLVQKNIGVRRLQYLWGISNILLIIFYGFLHQGGVLPLTRHVARELKAKPELTHIHLFTSYTYSLPTALLQLRNTKRTYTSSDQHRYKLKQDFFLYEQGSKAMSDVLGIINSKIVECETKLKSDKIPYRVYYALPFNSLSNFINEHNLAVNGTNNLTFSTVSIFYPHLTTEKLPLLNFTSNFECFLVDKLEVCFEKFISNLLNRFVQFFKNFGLLVIRIQYSKNIDSI